MKPTRRDKVRLDYDRLIAIGSTKTDAIDDLAAKYGVSVCTVYNDIKKTKHGNNGRTEPSGTNQGNE